MVYLEDDDNAEKRKENFLKTFNFHKFIFFLESILCFLWNNNFLLMHKVEDKNAFCATIVWIIMHNYNLKKKKNVELADECI